MANLALTSAKHQEIKDMANNIISAQTKGNWRYAKLADGLGLPSE